MIPSLDKTDLQILSLLVNDATMLHKDIAAKLNVSNATVHVRYKKMTDMGVILGSQIHLDYKKLGFNICAFVGIYLEKASVYSNVCDEIKKIKQIIELHYCTGVYSIFTKVICEDTNELREVLNDKIQKVKGIQRTETFISLEQLFYRNITIKY